MLNNILVKQLISFGRDGTTIKIVTAFLRGEEIKQKFLHEHFLKDDHHGFEKDVSIYLIDKTQSSDPHKREYYWMRTLKTLAPFGLNTEDTY